MRIEHATDVATDDVVQPFQVDRADVRGRLVRLGPALDRILGGHEYPEPVATLLGELLVVAVATRPAPSNSRAC
jgi:molecular chaperone Hsp33